MPETSSFPQADKLEQVGEVALAINAGNHADGEIEEFIGLDSGGRQGRYYRLAAVQLGLIVNHQNYAELTPLGEEFATLNSPASRVDFLARCLIDNPIFHSALLYIHKHHPTRRQLFVWFRSFYPGAESTADRRFSTFNNYLHDSGLIQDVEGFLVLSKFTGAVVKESIPLSDILKGGKGGSKGNKVDIKAPPPEKAPAGQISYDVDLQKLERANQIHWQLVTAKSSFLDGLGLQPYENENIDLFAEHEGDKILYEMKSINPELTNFGVQIRKAISQLYEYRYVFNEPDARLCVVTNTHIPDKFSWVEDYLSVDRSIAYEWTEDFNSFNCPQGSEPLLEMFCP